LTESLLVGVEETVAVGGVGVPEFDDAGVGTIGDIGEATGACVGKAAGADAILGACKVVDRVGALFDDVRVGTAGDDGGALEGAAGKRTVGDAGGGICTTAVGVMSGCGRFAFGESAVVVAVGTIAVGLNGAPSCEDVGAGGDGGEAAVIVGGCTMGVAGDDDVAFGVVTGCDIVVAVAGEERSPELTDGI